MERKYKISLLYNPCSYESALHVTGLLRALADKVEFCEIFDRDGVKEGSDALYFVDIDAIDLGGTPKLEDVCELPVIRWSAIKDNVPRAVDLELFKPEKGDDGNIWNRKFRVGLARNFTLEDEIKRIFPDSVEVDITPWGYTIYDLNEVVKWYRSIDCVFMHTADIIVDRCTHDMQCYGCGKPVLYEDSINSISYWVENLEFMINNYMAAYNHAQEMRNFMLFNNTWHVVADKYLEEFKRRIS